MSIILECIAPEVADACEGPQVCCLYCGTMVVAPLCASQGIIRVDKTDLPPASALSRVLRKDRAEVHDTRRPRFQHR